MRRVKTFFENLLFPPRCVSCHSFLQDNILDACNSPLCRRCRLEWEREKGEDCPDCGLELTNCCCIPSRLKKVGVQHAVKLVNYFSMRETVGHRAILSMKKHANHKVISFFAAQLSYPIRRYMAEQGLSDDEVALCYVPRGRRNVAKYGFDQSQLLCRSLAEAFGMPSYTLFRRVSRRGVEQKKLSAKEREENLQNRYAVNARAVRELPDTVRCLLLIDDIVTTGESMCRCVKAIGAYFDGEIVAVSIARTPKRQAGS